MAIYYISITGNDANTGSSANPFATVAAANAVVQPGDTVYFKAGTYHNATFGDGNIWKDGLDVALRINNVHGTAEAPITYAAEPGAAVKIQYDGAGAIRLQDATYIKFEGFNIEGPNGAMTLQEALAKQFVYRIDTNGNGSMADEVDHFRDPAATLTKTVAAEGGDRPVYYNSNAIAIGSGSNHIVIVNNKIHDSPGHAIASLGGADYVTVTGNEIYNNTWYSSSGNHAVSFNGVVSSDLADVNKIIVDGNYFHDNHNLLVSWSSLKTAPVTMAIDEGKTIHVQNATAALGFTHGSILISNNIVERAGNAGITVNDGDHVIIANNTIIDAGDLNRLIDAGLADPKIDAGFRVAAGGLRLAGGTDIQVINNLISISGTGLNAVDATAATTPANSTFAGNIYQGGTGLLLRYTGDVSALTAGFTQVTDAGFQDRAGGNYALLITSPAINAGSALDQGFVLKDFKGVMRAPGLMDVGAFEGDLTAPQVTAKPPVPVEGAVHVGDDLAFSFTEALKLGAAAITLTSATGTLVETFSASAASGLTFNNTALHINPAQDLKSNSLYHVSVADGALKDAAGNALAAFEFDIQTTPFAKYLTGDVTANTYAGSSDNDLLTGNGGIDTLDGKDGSDVYAVAASADHTAAEFHDTGTFGTDTVRFTASSGTLTLFAGDTGIERVVLGTGEGLSPVVTGTQAVNANAAKAPKGLSVIGNQGANAILGSAFADNLSGDGGNDSLSGGSGNDRIYGGLGADQLRGGLGVDQFIFNTSPTGIDTIADFTRNSDHIVFSDQVFRAFGQTSVMKRISAAEFNQGFGLTKARDASDNIIYDTKTGALYYDADGLGGHASVKFEQLGTLAVHPHTMAYTDFLFY